MENKHLIIIGATILVAVLVVLLLLPGSKLPGMDQTASPFGFGNNTSTSVSPSPVVSPITELQGADISVGTGSAMVAAGDAVTVDYVGALSTGQVFDDSYKTKRPFTFVVGAQSVIPGFERGVVGMKLGGKRKLIIPPSLGYGDKVSGPIPANSVLVFQVEIINIAPKSTESAILGQ